MGAILEVNWIPSLATERTHVQQFKLFYVWTQKIHARLAYVHFSMTSSMRT